MKNFVIIAMRKKEQQQRSFLKLMIYNSFVLGAGIFGI